MIRVQQQPEPADFDTKVRQPGRDFQRRYPRSGVKDLPSHWTKILPDLWKAYSGVCAYSSHWIPPTGGETVDHFIPKTAAPQLIYEWSNFRLAASKFNQRKSSRQDIVDPFKIMDEWFVLVFPGMLVKPGSKASPEIQRMVQTTINVLKLNEEVAVAFRLECVLEYCDRDVSFKGLQKRAPFIAFELARQGLVERIGSMMQRRRISKKVAYL